MINVQKLIDTAQEISLLKELEARRDDLRRAIARADIGAVKRAEEAVELEEEVVVVIKDYRVSREQAVNYVAALRVDREKSHPEAQFERGVRAAQSAMSVPPPLPASVLKRDH